MFTTAGSTRRAISTNDAESASGPRAAACISFWATAGRPARMAPMPIPVNRQTAARAAIHTRSLRKTALSASVVFLKDSNMIHRLWKNRPDALWTIDFKLLSGGSAVGQYSEREKEKLELGLGRQGRSKTFSTPLAAARFIAWTPSARANSSLIRLSTSTAFRLSKSRAG